MRPVFRCGACKLPVSIWQVRFTPGQPSDSVEPVPARFQRRSKPKAGPQRGVDRRFFHFLDVIGDRWTGLVVAALFFGCRRYDEIAEVLGIATNILSARLKMLVSAGVLRRVRYQQRPVRYEYRLSDKGADLYVHALQVHEWAERWLLKEGERPLLLTHRPCGSPLHSEVVCSECEKPLKPREVTYEGGPGTADQR
jgi:DNA-binding HxlR family transcriptional regulator